MNAQSTGLESRLDFLDQIVYNGLVKWEFAPTKGRTESKCVETYYVVGLVEKRRIAQMSGDVVIMKDKAVRLWVSCNRNCHVAAAIVKADKTLTMEDRDTLLDLLTTLHRLYS